MLPAIVREDAVYTSLLGVRSVGQGRGGGRRYVLLVVVFVTLQYHIENRSDLHSAVELPLHLLRLIVCNSAFYSSDEIAGRALQEP